MNTFRVEIRPSEQEGPSTAPPEKEAVSGRSRVWLSIRRIPQRAAVTACALSQCQKTARVAGAAHLAAALALLVDAASSSAQGSIHGEVRAHHCMHV